MKECTLLATLLAIPPFSLLPLELARRLSDPMQKVAWLIHEFRGLRTTPQSAFEFEQRLSQLLREVGRYIVEWAYNDCEAMDRDLLPTRIEHEGVWYQRNDRKTANRKVGTLFGTITLMRFLYRPVEELFLASSRWKCGWGWRRRGPRRPWPAALGNTPPSRPSRRCCEGLAATTA